ncbi:MAG: type II toxin-antitoxin system Phd/YefM family antitoxin [Actinobacteria bacterium]|nr:type II toxin-antitoxin system Phd/YefM family antitoxin [Actinomycetota bacterium]
MSTLPIADARAQLSRLIEDATTTHERFEITRNGRRAAVLLAAEDFDIIQETLDVLSDQALLAADRAGRAAVSAGDVLDEAQLAAAMQAAGRSNG